MSEIEKIPSQEPKLSYVTEHATLECNCGSILVKLGIVDPKRPLIADQRQATIMDNVAMVNIPSFGYCKTRNGPCTPVITLPWINGKEDTLINGFPVLTEQSRIACMTGGIISLKDNGFSSDFAAAAEAEKQRTGAGVQEMADGGLMMMIGLGAVAVGLAALAVITAPVSLPVLAVASATGLAVSTVATVGTVAAVGTVVAGGATMAMGGSDVIEGAQNAAGSSWEAVNPIRDTLFMGDGEAYGTAESIATNTAMVGSILLEPVAAMGVNTSASRLRTGNPANAAEETKLAESEAAESYQLREQNARSARRNTLSCQEQHEPVDVITGEVFLRKQDFTLPGLIPIEWNRRYGSQSRYPGACGWGWESPADIRLEFEKDGMVLFQDGTGAPSFFNGLPSGAPQLEPVDGRQLLEEDGSYVIRYQNGLSFYFLIPHAPVDRIRLDHIADRFGNSVQYHWDANGLREIRESSGRRIEVVSKQGRIESMALRVPGASPQLLVRYSYDAVGDLIAAYDALEVPYRFAYREHLMIRHTNRNGLSYYYEYDHYGPKGRCTHTWGDGGLYEGRMVYDDARRSVESTSTLGTTKFVYDRRYLVLEETDPLGGITQYEYDAYGRTTAVVDPDGHRTEYAYDRSGNIVQFTRPDGKVIVTEYDILGNPNRVADPNGAEWRQEWDAQGRLIREITPLGATFQYQYDSRGQLTGWLDALGNKTGFSYDAYGNLKDVTDALGHTTQYTYDALGKLTLQSAPLNKRRTRYQYDRKGRLVKVVLPGEAAISCEYDGEDHLVAYKDENGAVTRLEYCGDEVKRRIQPDGHTVEYEYNKVEQLTAVINQRGERYELKRDAAGRIVEEVDYWGQSRQYRYTPGGHLLESVDPLGRLIRYHTDPLGRILERVLPGTPGMGQVPVEQFQYDPNGNLVACTNRDIQVRRRFDLEGKLVEEQQGDDFRVVYTYDLNGNRISRTTTLGKGENAQRQTVKYSYDSLSQAGGVEIGDQQSIGFTRDALGQITRETLGSQVRRFSEYNEAGYLIRQTVGVNASQLFQQEYGYDKAGNLEKKQDSIFGTDKFYYDPMGRIIRQIDPANRIQKFLYDPAGDRLVTGVMANGATDEAPEWNRSGELESQTYRFDRAGNLVERKGAKQETRFVWDANQRLIESSQDGNTTVYRYDPLGRRISKETGGVTTRFFWEGDALLADARFEPSGREADAQPVCRTMREWVYYPGSFKPLALVQGDGLPEEADPNPGTRRIYYYANDPNGCPSRLLDECGKVVWAAARVDIWGQVKQLAANEVDQPLRLQGQYFDGETGLHYNRFRYYEPNIGAFVSQDPLGLAAGENVYRFAPNVLVWIDPLGLEALNTGGYSVYALYHEGATDPYYIGISKQGVDTRTGQHAQINETYGSARFDPSKDTYRVLESDLKYKEARGYEQAYIEHYETKTGFPGNAQNSFDTSRKDPRGKAFKREYNKANKRINGCG